MGLNRELYIISYTAPEGIQAYMRKNVPSHCCEVVEDVFFSNDHELVALHTLVSLEVYEGIIKNKFIYFYFK